MKKSFQKTLFQELAKETNTEWEDWAWSGNGGKTFLIVHKKKYEIKGGALTVLRKLASESGTEFKISDWDTKENWAKEIQRVLNRKIFGELAKATNTDPDDWMWNYGANDAVVPNFVKFYYEDCEGDGGAHKILQKLAKKKETVLRIVCWETKENWIREINRILGRPKTKSAPQPKKIPRGLLTVKRKERPTL